jgi:phosphonate transport system substrate-binding protein
MTMPSPNITSRSRRPRTLAGALAMTLFVVLGACGSDDDSSVDDTVAAIESTDVSATDVPATDVPATDAPAAEAGGLDPAGGTLRVGAIPDQDPEKLARTYGLLSDLLADELGVEVEYVPVTEYAAAVDLFRIGDLDLVWFGGLTGVQARLQTPGSALIAQRDIDENFRSVFIANVDADIEPIDDVAGLSVFDGRRFTFGSESSTSGRLMPQYFLDQAGIGPDSFDGEAGFSGSHDATIDLVEAGTFEGGALNEQVWRARVEEGTVDTDRVVEVFVSPTYHDYHWLVTPGAVERYGPETVATIAAVIQGLDPANPDHVAVLELFGAGMFIPTEEANYAEIEQIGRSLGLIVS